MIPLTDFDKILIVIAALSLVFLTALITVCKTCPGCYLYYYCPLRRYFDERERRQKQEYEQILYYGPPYVPSTKQKSNGNYMSDTQRRASLLAAYPTPVLPVLDSKNLFASQLPPPYSAVCQSREPSPNSTLTRGPLSSTSSSTTNNESYGDKPQLLLTVKFDRDSEKLTVEIKQAVNMPLSFLGTANDVFVRIFLIRDTKKRWRRKSQISLEEISDKGDYEVTKFQTQTVRKAANPHFNERFAAELKDSERRSTSLKLIAYVTDRFAQESTVGDVHVHLHRIQPNVIKDLTLTLKEVVCNLGEITVSLTYLPTAERLCVLVQKVTNLKAPEGHSVLNPYVRGCLLMRQKTVEKYKTAISENTHSPVINETLTFHLPKDEIEKATVILTVLHDPIDVEVIPQRSHSPAAFKSSSLKVRRRSVSNILEVTKSDPTNIYKSRSSNSVRSRPIILGRVAFGSTTHRETKAHWDEIIMTPRVQVTQLHKLRQ